MEEDIRAPDTNFTEEIERAPDKSGTEEIEQGFVKSGTKHIETASDDIGTDELLAQMNEKDRRLAVAMARSLPEAVLEVRDTRGGCDKSRQT